MQLINRAAFDHVRTVRGTRYADVNTAAGDLDRLLVAVVEVHNSSELTDIFHRRWKGSPNTRAFRELTKVYRRRSRLK
jgi:hypothetical protein